MVRKVLLAVATSALLWPVSDALAKPSKGPAVAVVVDPVTYEKAGQAIDEYVSSMELDGKKGILVIDRWGIPDSIRVKLERMYERDNLEGAVLVGDIPVPMIRDAQHFCSAFKMDQKRPWHLSSVPSDRYYDDFNLDFRFLKRDEEREGFFYYSLTSKSPQHISSSIYSARIKPIECPEKYRMIEAYLRKAVAAKRAAAGIDNLLLFAGHGYNSESMAARMDEYLVLHEQFPALKREECRLDFINFDYDESVKTRLLSALSDKNLDMAILHHHGYNDVQLLNGSPFVSSPDGWLSLAKNYFRTKMRQSRNPEKTKKDFMEQFGIPGRWLDEAFEKEYADKDSLYARGMNIYTDDISRYSIGARFIILDACFNGEFTEQDYVAARYVFGESNATVAVLARSVNTIQDYWTNELAGLTNEGICLGNIYKNIWNLEIHLFGDPTFHFGPLSRLDKDISLRRADAKVWKDILKDEEYGCEVKSLAIRMLLRMSAISGKELIEIQKESASPIVRLAALNGNIVLAGESLTEAISIGLDDNYELIQRLSARYAGYNQSPELAEKIVRLYLSPTTSARVNFQAKTAMLAIGKDTVLPIVKSSPYWKGDQAKADLTKFIETNYESTSKEIDNLMSPQPHSKDARLFIRSQRNACRTDVLRPMETFYRNTSDPLLKKQVAETFGWYRYSYAKQEAEDICRRLVSEEKDPELIEELNKSIARLGF